MTRKQRIKMLEREVIALTLAKLRAQMNDEHDDEAEAALDLEAAAEHLLKLVDGKE